MASLPFEISFWESLARNFGSVVHMLVEKSIMLVQRQNVLRFYHEKGPDGKWPKLHPLTIAVKGHDVAGVGKTRELSTFITSPQALNVGARSATFADQAPAHAAYFNVEIRQKATRKQAGFLNVLGAKNAIPIRWKEGKEIFKPARTLTGVTEKDADALAEMVADNFLEIFAP